VQPRTNAWLWVLADVRLSGPNSVNACVSRSVAFELIKMLNQGSPVGRGCACTEVKLIDTGPPAI